MTYSATMPLLNILTLATLVLAFHFDKLFLLRFYRAPPIYSEVLPRLITYALFGAAFANCAMGIWSFGNIELYAPDLRVVTSVVGVVWGNATLPFLVGSHDWHGSTTLAQRIQNPMNTFAVIICVSIVLCATVPVVMRACIKLCKQYIPGSGLPALERKLGFIQRLVQRQGSVGSLVKNPSYFDAIPYEYLVWRLESGAVQGNIRRRYIERFKHLNAIEQDEELFGKTRRLIGLESYNLSLNMDYTIKFGINTHHLQRVKPKDWIINKNVEARRRSIALGAGLMPRDARRASLNLSRQSLDFTNLHLAQSDSMQRHSSYAKQIDNLVRECSPIKEGREWKPTRMSILVPESLPLHNYASQHQSAAVEAGTPEEEDGVVDEWDV
jgi:hypothetical protein